MTANARYTLIALILIGRAASATPPVKEAVDYVSPNIGGVGQLLTATAPYVQYPYGMARVAPATTPGIADRYLADRIYGFAAGPATLMASVGHAGSHLADYASDFDHDFETAAPYYYSVDLLTWMIKAEVTVTSRAELYRFTFPADPHQTRQYFYAEVSKPFTSSKTWNGGDVSDSGKQVGIVADFAVSGGEQVEVRVGLSYISADQARRNLEHKIPNWGFVRVKSKAREAWREALNKIKVEGGTERQRTIFYTALYRSLGRMTDITKDGQYFSGYDHAVHESNGRDFYVDDGIWDAYRSLHPLQLLLDADRQQDMIRSYLRMYEQSGWLPSFPEVSGNYPIMLGHHAAQFILDTYVKGYRNFDVEEAYAGIRKNATEASMLPWRHNALTTLDRAYFEKGFFPALAYGEKESVPEVRSFERRQAVSVTLENAYDDWCVAQLAKALGKQDDYLYFIGLAHNYEHVFNPTIGFMAPKSADGKWVANFDPILGGGQGGRDYFTEMNAWTYTFNVQHDPAGLIQLIGGRDAFNAKLDQLFVEQYGGSKSAFLRQFPDATGLIGQYAQGNEPSFHIPYLYDFSGQPWKTQRRVREIMDLLYGDGPQGIPGDDDGGATSSWYVLSALGFYPECPGSPVYEIGSPIFSKSTITLGNGKIFTTIADHVSAQNKYIQSARLNGRSLGRAWFQHGEISSGGALVLEMGDKPNLQWGSPPEDAPPYD
jgi:predicted alpha-1,2-mannosidase